MIFLLALHIHMQYYNYSEITVLNNFLFGNIYDIGSERQLDLSFPLPRHSIKIYHLRFFMPKNRFIRLKNGVHKP